MGRLPWRERWSVLGCRRGWVRLVPFVAFVLVGYFALYAWLRVTNEIELGYRVYGTGADNPWNYADHYYAIVWMDDPPDIDIDRGEWPRLWMMRAMWAAVKLEVALDRCGWHPWGGLPRLLPSPRFDGEPRMRSPQAAERDRIEQMMHGANGERP